MPVPWDRCPPTCQGVNWPPVTQPPVTTASSGSIIHYGTVTIREPPPIESLMMIPPDLQSDSAPPEDETDGGFPAMDLIGANFAGAIPQISPEFSGFLPVQSSRSSSEALINASYNTMDQLTLNAHGTLYTGVHSSNLVNDLDRLSLSDSPNRTTQRSTLVTDSSSDRDCSGGFRSRGFTLSNANLNSEPLISNREPEPLHRSGVVIREPPSLQIHPFSQRGENIHNQRDQNQNSANNGDENVTLHPTGPEQGPRDGFQCDSNSGYAIWFQEDSDGDTPLLLAIIHQASAQAIQLIQRVPSPELLDHRNQLHQSALHLAVLTHQPLVVRALVLAGAPLDTRDRHGNTALHLSCRQGDVDSVSALTLPIESANRENLPILYSMPSQPIPQDLSIMNYSGETCLHVSVLSGHLRVIEYLLSQRHIRANPNVSDGKSGRTILHLAVEQRDVPLVLFLLARKEVQVNCSTFDGTTPLALAIGRGYMDIANLLVSGGADPALVHLSDSESDCDCASMEEEDS